MGRTRQSRVALSVSLSRQKPNFECNGAPLSQLPSDQRIYAGGGGSVRPTAI